MLVCLLVHVSHGYTVRTPLKIQKLFGFAPHPLGVEIQLSLLVSACISFLATVGTAQIETWVLPNTLRFTPSLSHSE